jgi:hypothetical protein
MQSTQCFRLTTSAGIVKDYFLESCAQLFQQVHGGTIEARPIQEFQSI